MTWARGTWRCPPLLLESQNDLIDGPPPRQHAYALASSTSCSSYGGKWQVVVPSTKVLGFAKSVKRNGLIDAMEPQHCGWIPKFGSKSREAGSSTFSHPTQRSATFPFLHSFSPLDNQSCTQQPGRKAFSSYRCLPDGVIRCVACGSLRSKSGGADLVGERFTWDLGWREGTHGVSMQVIYIIDQAEMWITSWSIDHESFIAEIFMRRVVSTLGWLAEGFLCFCLLFKKYHGWTWVVPPTRIPQYILWKSSNQYFNFTSNDV